MRALLVDDDPTARFVLRLALTRELSWTTLEASDGREALRVLETSDVGVVFLDLHMPGLGGIETLRILRESPRHRTLPVIVMTSDNQEESVNDAIALGVADYLVKPLRSPGIAARVERALAKVRMACEASVSPAQIAGQPAREPEPEDREVFGRQLVSAAEQVLGMMLSTDVERLRVAPQAQEEGVSVIVNLDEAGTPVWRFELVAPMSSARKISGTFAGIASDAVTPEGLTSTVNELARMISGRVRNVIREAGRNAQCSVPHPAATAWPPDVAPSVAPFVFLRAGECLFAVSMTYAAEGAHRRA